MCVFVCPHIRYKRRKENCLTRKSYTQHVFRVGKKSHYLPSFMARKLDRADCEPLHRTLLLLSGKRKKKKEKKILWAFYCRIGSEETAGARLFFFFFFFLSLSLPLSFFFDAVLSRCSTSGKGESEKQRWWLGRGRAGVINNCISLSDAGNSVWWNNLVRWLTRSTAAHEC